MKSLSKRIVHPIIKVMIRTTASVYFEKVNIKGLEHIPEEGPAILACNHPNSFLDALIITVYYRRPIYYVARGDAFKKPFGAKVLSFLNNVPIFRKEEGANNLYRNEETFTHCIEILKEGDTVLLFAEGICENEWFLRPLRKGTARLVHDARNTPEVGEKMKVIPVATNYSQWHDTGHITHVELLKPIDISLLAGIEEQGAFLKKFNAALNASLSEQVASIDKAKDTEAQNTVTGFLLKNMHDHGKLARKALKEFSNPDATAFHKIYVELANYIKKEKLKYYEPYANIVSFMAAAFIYPLAIALNFIPYFICKFIAEKTTKHNVFFDSVFFGSILVLGPVYTIVLGILSVYFTHSWYGLLLPVITLLSAWSYESAKRNIYSYLHRKKLANVTAMLTELFGKDNG